MLSLSTAHLECSFRHAEERPSRHDKSLSELGSVGTYVIVTVMFAQSLLLLKVSDIAGLSFRDQGDALLVHFEFDLSSS